jgi:hypothetical protein
MLNLDGCWKTGYKQSLQEESIIDTLNDEAGLRSAFACAY